MLLGTHVLTLRFIYGCINCGEWSLVHEEPFTLHEHVKTVKTDEKRFFCSKAKSLLSAKPMPSNVAIESTKKKQERNVQFVRGQQNFRNFWRCVLSNVQKCKKSPHVSQ